MPMSHSNVSHVSSIIQLIKKETIGYTLLSLDSVTKLSFGLVVDFNVSIFFGLILQSTMFALIFLFWLAKRCGKITKTQENKLCLERY